MKVVNNQPNRIDAMMAQWDQEHNKYVARYGQNIVLDREYQKAQRDVYDMIFQKFKNDKRMTFGEKIDLRIHKGQLNRMNRELHKRPMRILRGAGKILGSILKASILLPARVMSMLILNRQIPNNNALTQVRRPVIAPSSPGLQTGKVIDGIKGVNIIPKQNGEKSQNQRNHVSSAPAKVVQRNFKNSPRSIVTADKGKSRRI